MQQCRPRDRRRAIARAIGAAGALAIVLGATAVAPATAAEKPPVTSTTARSDEYAPWAPQNDDVRVHPKAVHQAVPHSHADPSPLQLTLPAPTGRSSVGMVGLHLIDKSRTDPYVPGNRVRELMVSLWYPTSSPAGHYQAPWMSSVAGAHFLSTSLGLTPQQVTVPRTAGHVLAPVDTRHGKLPVLLYSTGLHSDRAMGTALVQDLASRGYLVVTVDHTHDANEVQFPGNRLEVNTMPAGAHSSDTLKVRAADIRFVINQLGTIAKGGDPDAGHAKLPTGLSHAVDTSRIGMFGFSLGGGAVDTAMQLDHRIGAGADLDGQFFGSAPSKDLDRPFMLFSSGTHNRNNDGSWRTLWAHLKGYRVDVQLHGATHLTFYDNAVLAPQYAPLVGWSQATVQQMFGTIDPTRAIKVQRDYLAAFFDRTLLHQRRPVLDGPSKSYPEISFVR
ncbi:hydrolase [Streptomyces sp. NPDC001851]|uniref:alpha/beta hydrolase family protein n=1 Tax=Streptomyces sp. NPDC001851 TaxID=3154529 RepID=UPI0033331A4C